MVSTPRLTNQGGRSRASPLSQSHCASRLRGKQDLVTLVMLDRGCLSGDGTFILLVLSRERIISVTCVDSSRTVGVADTGAES